MTWIARIVVVTAASMQSWDADRAQAGQGPRGPRSQDSVLDLSGAWRVLLDAEDRGVEERWFAGRLESDQRIGLPGTTDLAGLGHRLDPESMTYPVEFPYSKFPAAAETERADERGFLAREHLWLGRAWYQRDVEITPSWEGLHVQLLLERVLWKSEVWVDDRLVGAHDSLVAAHRHDLGVLAPGIHRLTICVDNRMIHNISTIGHAYGPETQSRWNGVVGRIELVATPVTFLRRLEAHPAADRQSVRARVHLQNGSGAPRDGRLRVEVVGEEDALSRGGATTQLELDPGRTTIEVVVPLEQAAEPWTEFSTTRYRLMARLESDDGEDEHTTLFGFRRIERDGRQVRVNGRRIFLRGTLDCGVYPRTGHPPTTVEEWLRVFGTIREYGFNHVRFHTWCPPEAAFEAADRLGLYLAPETPFWTDDWTTSTVSRPQGLGNNVEVTGYVRSEIRRILEAYGNHPSFALFCIGNEFGMNATDWNAVEELIAEAKALDPRRLYSATTARKRTAADDFWVTHSTGPERTRGVGSPDTIWDFKAAARSTDLPLIAHETGQRPVFPDYDRFLTKFTGPLQPHNYRRLRRATVEAGLLDQVPAFHEASARFQLVQYKAEHEALLRTHELAGYQLLMLNDFTGQSEALVGVLDPFWESKGVVRVQDVTQWNAPTVVLARFSDYVLSTAESLVASFEAAHHGAEDLGTSYLQWTLATAAGELLGGGVHGPMPVDAGGVTRFGTIEVPLGTLQEATALQLQAGLGDALNTWNLWAYPPPGEEPQFGDVLVRPWLDDEAERTLAEGGRVLLLAHSLKNRHVARTGFLSVYWSAGWWGNRFSSLGVLCDPQHPALADFPNEGHSDWQWYELTEGATTFLLDDAPAGFRPIVQPVTDFHHNRLLGQVFEARVGSGRLLVCGYDLERDLESRHAARQLRRSLLRYVTGEQFEPTAELPLEFVRKLLAPSRMQQLGATIATCDSFQPGFEAGNVLDGDPATIWHTPWGGAVPDFPHEIVVHFPEPIPIAGILVLPRQDGNPNGWIRGYDVLVSEDGALWNSPLASGELEQTADPKTIRFPAPATGRFLKLIALSPFDDQPFASLAELEILETPRSP